MGKGVAKKGTATCFCWVSTTIQQNRKIGMGFWSAVDIHIQHQRVWAPHLVCFQLQLPDMVAPGRQCQWQQRQVLYSQIQVGSDLADVMPKAVCDYPSLCLQTWETRNNIEVTHEVPIQLSHMVGFLLVCGCTSFQSPQKGWALTKQVR